MNPISRRLLLALALVAAFPVLRAQSLPADAQQPPTSAADRHKALDALFRQYWESELKHSPEYASELGDKRWNAQISDDSVQAANDRVQREQDLLMQLAAIDPAGLDDQDQTSRELLMRTLADNIEAADYKEWEMPITQLGGIYTRYPELARHLTFASTQDYDDWIARLRAVPAAFAQVSENMSIGIEDRRTPPRYLVEKALAQVKELAAQKPEDSPLALPLKSFPAAVPLADRDRIRTEMLDAIAKQVQPAYLRFARFLQASYIPACRADAGIWAIPGGDKYYQFLIRRTTTTNLTTAQIHQIGLDQVARDEAQMLLIAQKLGYKDLKSFQAAVKADPKFHPASPEALMDAYKANIAAMQAKLPTLFGRLPKAQLEVVPVPDYRAKTAAAAYYEPGSPDLSRPGRVTVNLYDATSRSLADVEAISYHEGVPGHHLQISIAQELTGLPDFRKHLFYTAYTEGWGLYAEQLGKDAGFYRNPISDYGRLEADIWRAIRLVVDTGVHSQHWTREQMVDYFRAHSSIDEPNIQSEVDRYIAWPGQALGYKIGQMEMLALRAEAQRALGDKFSLSAFHDQVLGAGALPLDLLDARITAWVKTQASAAIAKPE
ncbi:MAG: DUF885 domain-containing protein [Terracidiphilus sp.]|nr:DUF885 domain-containing protein [Terracidiphilus sp.]